MVTKCAVAKFIFLVLALFMGLLAAFQPDWVYLGVSGVTVSSGIWCAGFTFYPFIVTISNTTSHNFHDLSDSEWEHLVIPYQCFTWPSFAQALNDVGYCGSGDHELFEYTCYDGSAKVPSTVVSLQALSVTLVVLLMVVVIYEGRVVCGTEQDQLFLSRCHAHTIIWVTSWALSLSTVVIFQTWTYTSKVTAGEYAIPLYTSTGQIVPVTSPNGQVGVTFVISAIAFVFLTIALFSKCATVAQSSPHHMRSRESSFLYIYGKNGENQPLLHEGEHMSSASTRTSGNMFV